MTDETPIADAIAAVQHVLGVMVHHSVFDDVISPLHREGLRAALTYLEDYERVVAERDKLRRENEILAQSLTDSENEAEKFRRNWERVRSERDAARAELAALQRTFDLQWKADQRAIKQWQEAHPGNDLVWPDRCNMVVWLLDQLDAAKATIDDEEASGLDSVALIGRVRAELAEARDEILRLQKDVLTASYDEARAERLRAPSSEDAMEAAYLIIHQAQTTLADPITVDPTSALEMLRDDIAHALITARAAEREKCRARTIEECAHLVEKIYDPAPASATGHSAMIAEAIRCLLPAEPKE